MSRYPDAHASWRERERDVPVAIRPEYACPSGLEHPDDCGRRVPEAVPLTDADDRDLRVPGCRALRSEPVRAAVVRKLQDLHVAEGPRFGHTTLRGFLGISSENHLNVPDAYLQDDAGVVRSHLLRLLCRLFERPEDAHRSRADPEGVRGPEVHTTHAPPRCQPRQHTLHAGVSLGVDCRGTDPADPHDAHQTGEAADVVIVVVRQHDAVEPAHALSSERPPDTCGIRTGVHKHG
jgi:hypothetical protein